MLTGAEPNLASYAGRNFAVIVRSELSEVWAGNIDSFYRWTSAFHDIGREHAIRTHLDYIFETGGLACLKDELGASRDEDRVVDELGRAGSDTGENTAHVGLIGLTDSWAVIVPPNSLNLSTKTCWSESA